MNTLEWFWNLLKRTAYLVLSYVSTCDTDNWQLRLPIKAQQFICIRCMPAELVPDQGVCKTKESANICSGDGVLPCDIRANIMVLPQCQLDFLEHTPAMFDHLVPENASLRINTQTWNMGCYFSYWASSTGLIAVNIIYVTPTWAMGNPYPRKRPSRMKTVLPE